MGVMLCNERVPYPRNFSHTSHCCLPEVPQQGDSASGHGALAHASLPLRKETGRSLQLPPALRMSRQITLHMLFSI